MARILAISSFVVRGHVGNSALIFPLMRLGHEILPLPTTVLAHHPGHARGAIRATVPHIVEIGEDALFSPREYPVDAALVGYLAEPSQAVAAARLIASVREDRGRSVPILLDPVCADGGALYVVPQTPGEIVRHLLGLADIVTPNVTELAALAAPGEIAEAPGWNEDRIIGHARGLGRPCVVVTTSPASRSDRAANLVITADAVHRVETPRVDWMVHGTGDLLAGLILAGMVDGERPVAATARAAAIVHDVLVETARHAADEMVLAGAQERIVSPLTRAEIVSL